VIKLKLAKRGQYNVVSTHINHLQGQNNLLRFVMSPPDMFITLIADIAKKTKRCIHILIHNFLEVINDKNPLNLRLPAADDQYVFEFKIDAVENDKPGR